SSFAFVASGGIPFVIDHRSRRVLYTPDCNFIQGAVSIPAFSAVLAYNFTHLYVVGQGRILWQSRRVSMDGIHIASVTKSIISGTVQGFHEEEKFSLTVGDWRYESGFQCPAEIGGYQFAAADKPCAFASARRLRKLKRQVGNEN